MSKVIRRFMEWLGEDTNWSSSIGYVVFAALTAVSVDYMVHNTLLNWHLIPTPNDPLVTADDNPFRFENFYSLVFMFAWAPVKEEIIFRVIPLFFVIRFVTQEARTVFVLIVVMAIGFGAVHPYGLEGRFDVALAGFFFGLVFLKCGGLKGNFVKAAMCAMAAHGLSNVLSMLDSWWDYMQVMSIK